MSSVLQEPDNRPIVYGEEGKYIYRASSCGRCSRSLVAARLGFEPLPLSDKIQEAADEGRRQEPLVIAELTARNFMVWAQQEVVEIPLPSALIRGHIDGKIVLRSGPPILSANGYSIEPHKHMLLEVKTMGPSVYAKWLKSQFSDPYFYPYAVQASVYMYAEKLPLLFCVKMRETEKDCPDTRYHVILFYYEKLPIEAATIIKRMLAVEFAARSGELPPCDRDDYFCQFPYLCDKRELKASREIDASTINEVAVTAWSKKYIEAQELKKKYEQIEKEARSRLLELSGYKPSNIKLGEPKVTGLKYANSLFSLSVYESDRESVSVTKMREVFGAAVDPYINVTRYPNLRLKDLKAPTNGEKE